MKTLGLSVITIALLAACNTTPQKDTVAVHVTDTAGLAHFQEWKEQQKIIEAVAIYNAQKQADVAAQQPTPAPAVRYVVEKRATPVRRTTPVRTSAPAVSNDYPVATGGGGGIEQPMPQQQKKGWSKAAKGTVIGAGSGAALGAIISKNKKGKGAIIGGVVGAAGGYAIGRSMDKKDGRY